jgi:hypothetical protein
MNRLMPHSWICRILWWRGYPVWRIAQITGDTSDGVRDLLFARVAR